MAEFVEARHKLSVAVHSLYQKPEHLVVRASGIIVNVCNTADTRYWKGICSRIPHRYGILQIMKYVCVWGMLLLLTWVLGQALRS